MAAHHAAGLLAAVQRPGPRSAQAHKHHHHGRWLPTLDTIEQFVSSLREQTQAEGHTIRSKSVLALQQLLEKNWQLQRLADLMIREVPMKYAHDTSRNPRLRDVQ